MKRFSFTLFCAFVLLCACVTNSQAQKQIIGSFPGVEGGFDNQATGSLATALSTTVWSKANSTLVTASITTAGSGPRTGPDFATTTTNTIAGIVLQTPQAANLAANTTYTVQFMSRNSAAVTGLIIGIGTNGLSNTAMSSSTNLTAGGSTWTLRTATLVTPATTVTSAGAGYIKTTKGTLDVDDYVIYPGAADNTAPDPVTGAGTSNVTNSSVTVNWTAPVTGVDGGGYMVLRYTTDPSLGATLPNTNGIYAIGNTIGSGTIMYLGTGTSYTDNTVSSNTQYYYSVHTVDKAFNYATAVTVNATASAGGLVPSATSLGFANTGLGASSAEQSFTVSGSGLTGNLVVTAPTGFLVSATSGSGYSSSVSITPSSGTVSSVPVYAVFHPVASGSVSDNIVVSSTGYPSINVGVTGYGSVAYQSKQSGDWGDPNTWQYYNGSSWTDASATPSNNDLSTTIQGSHTVTISSGISAGQLTINGNLTIYPTNTLTIVHGSNTEDLVIGNGGVLLNQGTMTMGTAATWEIQNGATYIHNNTATPATLLASALTIDNGSTFIDRDPSATSFAFPGTAFYNFSFESTAGIASFGTSGSFTVNGKLSVGANITWTNTATITLNGNLDITGTFNTSGFSLAATKTLAVYPGGVLTIPNSGQVITVGSGSLLVLSDATGTGSIGASGGTINGNVTVQRFIPAHGARAYTLVSSPVSSPTINSSWQEGGAATPGYGTQISGASTGSGFDFASAAGIASIYSYSDNNAPGSKWVGLTSTLSSTLNAGTGYLLFVRGDRTVGAGSGAPAATTLRATGSITSGTVNFATASGIPVGTAGTPTLLSGANQYNLVANPYACAIKWSTLVKTNLASAYTVYDPNLQAFVTSTGTIVSPNNSQQQADVLQPGQAFFIQNGASGTPALSVKETDKIVTAATGTSNTVFGMEAPLAQLNINCYKAGNVFADGAVAVFNNQYSREEDATDAAKFTNFGETVSFVTNNRSLSIDARPMPYGSDTLFVALKQMVANASYTMVIDGTGFNSSNLQTAVLVDKATGTRTPLDLSTKTSYPFTALATGDTGRLYIVLNSAAVVTVPPPAVVDSSNNNNTPLQVVLLGNPVKDQIVLSYKASQPGNTSIRVFNASGQAMNSQRLGIQQQGTVTIPVVPYAEGLYLVEVTVGSEKVIAKVVKE